jgi:SAM-dependent methyltransferase
VWWNPAVTAWDASTYGERIADVYDQMTFPELPPAPLTVALLADLVGPGPVLELGVGTGRIALPLAERGVQVQGIDASPAMVERMRAKPGGDAIPVTIGDFADVEVEGTFSLVFIVFNTFFALLTQDDQVRCFANVAAHLGPGGVFVIEGFVPDLTRFDRDQRVGVLELTMDEVHLDASRHDPATQRVSSRHVLLSEQGTRIVPVELRYAWPSELDLMARLARLRLRQRWGGWQKEPFGSSSPRHVSVYEKE